MAKYWCVSDFHFNHKNIIKYCDRPFKTIEEMNQAIISNINSVVNTDDYLLCLGDWCFGRDSNKDTVITTRNAIKCKNISLVYGNHDDIIRKNTGLQRLFTGCYEYLCQKIYDRWILMVHRTDTPQMYKIIDKFRQNYKDGVVLFGHSHQKKDVWQNMCLEVNEYKPVDLELLLKEH